MTTPVCYETPSYFTVDEVGRGRRNIPTSANEMGRGGTRSTHLQTLSISHPRRYSTTFRAHSVGCFRNNMTIDLVPPRPDLVFRNTRHILTSSRIGLRVSAPLRRGRPGRSTSSYPQLLVSAEATTKTATPASSPQDTTAQPTTTWAVRRAPIHLPNPPTKKVQA